MATTKEMKMCEQDFLFHEEETLEEVATFFPLLIQYLDEVQPTRVDSPEDLEQRQAFLVLVTNYKGGEKYGNSTLT